MGLATLMAQAGDAERAVEVLTLVRGAASIDRRTETKAEQLEAKILRSAGVHAVIKLEGEAVMIQVESQADYYLSRSVLMHAGYDHNRLFRSHNDSTT